MGKFFLGFVVALLLIVGGGWAYLNHGKLPVAVSDPPFPMEKRIVDMPLDARIDHNMQQAPFPAGEDALEQGAAIYREQCADCHGIPGAPVKFAAHMYPTATQLFVGHTKKDGTKVVGVSDDEVGETFWKVKNGIRLTGMPSFQTILSEPEMWDVSWLLKNADQPMPDPVKAILK